MTGPRDWDKELAEIDKLIASGAGAPAAGAATPPPVRAGQPTASSPDALRPAGPPVTLRRHILGAWFKGLLGVLGAAALFSWPYNKSCGAPLYLYLLGVTAVTLAGAWAMRGSWTHRRGVVHVVGLLVLLAGLGLAAAEILPRVGYAQHARTWTCP